MRKDAQAGQIGVIMVLIMSVLLTVGLSLAANTSREVVTTTQEEESNRVFNAAEAGIEQALSGEFDFAGDQRQGSVGNIADVTVDYTVSKVRELETRLFEGTSATVDVTGVAAGQGLQIDFSRDNDCATQDIASLLIGIYSTSGSDTLARYVAIDGCSHSSGFELANSISDGDYRRRYVLPLAVGDVQVRVQPLYNDTHLRVSGAGWTLPVQGYAVRSEAQSELGQETRIVQVNRSLPTAPSVMDYVLYSGAGIEK